MIFKTPSNCHLSTFKIHTRTHTGEHTVSFGHSVQFFNIYIYICIFVYKSILKELEA